MPNRSETRLETLAEASDQFHWGTDPDTVEAAAGALDRLKLNPALARALEAKAARMRAVAGLMWGGLAAAGPLLPTTALAAAPSGR